MSVYIALISFTDQGIARIKDSPKRLDQARELLAGMGGRFLNFYMTMGDYDLIIVYEAPDDACAARFSLTLGAAGNIRTTTMKAFPENAYREIIASLP